MTSLTSFSLVSVSCISQNGTSQSLQLSSMQADAGECFVSVLLILSDAFATVDHYILSERKSVGVSVSALNWFSSYLSEDFYNYS